MKGIELLKLISEGKIEKGSKFHINNGGLIEWDGEGFRLKNIYKSIWHMSIIGILSSEFKPVGNTERETDKTEETQEIKLTVRDFFIDELISKNAVELKEKLIKELDGSLDKIGLILSEREPSIYCRFDNIEEASQTYKSIIEFRKSIKSLTLNNFISLNQENIIEPLAKIYKTNPKGYSLKGFLADTFDIK